MNKNSKPPLQFTKLTFDDITAHGNIYITLLGFNDYKNNYKTLDEKHQELQKTTRIFLNTFK